MTEEYNPSVQAEVAGAGERGSSDSGREMELSVESISSQEPRDKLAQATKDDTTLAMALADKQTEGYYWVEGLVNETGQTGGQ